MSSDKIKHALVSDGVTAKMMFNYPDAVTRLLDIRSLEDIVGQKEATNENV